MQTDQHTQQPNNRSGEEIMSGAGNEDQLERLTPAESNNNAEQHGTPPSTGDEHLQAAKITDKVASDNNNSNTESQQETIADKNGDVNDLGGAINLSLDQLVNEGDNNQ